MKHRLKWLLVGVGVMYSLQSVILLAIRYLIPHSGPAEFFNLLATMVYTLLAFLGGGFVIGRMAEQLRIIEPTLTAVAALLLDVLSTHAGSFEGIFLFSIALQEANYGTPLIIGAIGIVAAIAGALAGERLAVPQEDCVSQVLLAVGLAGLLLGPFLLSASYLSLTPSIIIGLALLAGILIAAYRFGKRQRNAQIFRGAACGLMSIHRESS